MVLSDEGGTAATLEGAVPPYNSNVNKNENAEEVATAETVEEEVPPSNSNKN